MENEMSKKKTPANKQSKVNEFLGYALGISLIFLTGMMLLLSYAEVLHLKHMGK
jgi:hypothetical protein